MNKHKRRIIAMLAATAMASSAGTAIASHQLATPAQGVHWAQEHGIMQGYEDGTLRPNQEVTRGEVAAMLLRYHTNTQPAEDEPMWDCHTMGNHSCGSSH